MALWGNQDNLTGPTPVTVVGTASSEFWTVSATGMSASGVSTEGNTVLLAAAGSGDTPGSAGFLTLEAELATDLYRVGKMSGIGTEVLGVDFDAAYSTQPISLKNDPGYAESSADGSLGRTQVIAGVSTAGIDAIAPGITTTVGGIHAGWVGIMTYVDMHGNLRTKTETFVAASGIQTGNRPFPA